MRPSTPANIMKANEVQMYQSPTSELFTAVQYRQPVGVAQVAERRSSWPLRTSGSP